MCQNNKKNIENKKFNFKEKKENTISSLFEVEYFLNKLNKTLKYIKFYNLLK